jgi:hypothetical protein
MTAAKPGSRMKSNRQESSSLYMKVPMGFLGPTTTTGPEKESTIGPEQTPTDETDTTMKLKRTQQANFGVAALHFVLVIAYSAWYGSTQIDDDAPIVIFATCWVDMDNMSMRNSDLTPSNGRKKTIAACVIAFHLLSFLFQMMPWLATLKGRWVSGWSQYPNWYTHVTWYIDTIKSDGIQLVRYLEYSFSAPLMMIAIALSFGVLEFYMLLFIAVLTWCCMIFGLAADCLRFHLRNTNVSVSVYYELRRFMLFFHLASWVTIIVPWAILWQIFVKLSGGMYDQVCDANESIGGKMPDFVYVVVIGQTILFSLFGGVQVAQILRVYRNGLTDRSGGTHNLKDGIWSERIFIGLSLCSKTLLGMLLFANVVIVADDDST